MTPYYSHAGIVIYHGDCREILPTLPKCDLLLTDPPYGIDHPTNYRERGRAKLANTRDFEAVCGDDEAFDPSLFIHCNAILWGSNYFADKLPVSSGWLVWDKRTQNDVGVNDQADGELAWSNCVKGVRIFRHMWNGFWRGSERGESYHPTQKPVALMKWCITRLPECKSIIDPYMGSGPVLIAAKALGLTAIGIELHEPYCEIAAKRLSQEVFDFAQEAINA